MLSFTCRTIDFIGNYVNFQYFLTATLKIKFGYPWTPSCMTSSPPSRPRVSCTGQEPWQTVSPGGAWWNLALKKIYTYIIFYLDEPRIFMLFHSLYLTLIYKVYTRFTCGQNKLKNVQILILVHPLWMNTEINDNIYGIFKKKFYIFYLLKF